MCYLVKEHDMREKRAFECHKRKVCYVCFLSRDEIFERLIQLSIWENVEAIDYMSKLAMLAGIFGYFLAEKS